MTNLGFRVVLSGPTGFFEEVEHSLEHESHLVFFSVLAAILMFFVFWLFCYHLFLIAIGQTTNEHLKGVYAAHSKANPHDKGCIGNFAALLCHVTPASKIPDLTALVAFEGDAIVDTSNETKEPPVAIAEPEKPLPAPQANT